jgi:hypothetical protein
MKNPPINPKTPSSKTGVGNESTKFATKLTTKMRRGVSGALSGV